MENTVIAEEFCDLIRSGETYTELFNQTKGTWWLDILNSSVEEMKILSKAFSIHSLTNENIHTQDSREKVELFRTYYFICFRSFESNAESWNYLEPANMYIIVFQDELLMIHFTNISHITNIKRRIRQLRDYVNVSSDWICYTLIDDNMNAFGSLVNMMKEEMKVIEDVIMIAWSAETRDMLTRMSLLRKKILRMLKLLDAKADVIKMFAKRCNEHWDIASIDEIELYLDDIEDSNLYSKIKSNFEIISLRWLKTCRHSKRFFLDLTEIILHISLLTLCKSIIISTRS